MDEDYYKLCTVHIRTKKDGGCLPPQHRLREFLRGFGPISAFYEWRHEEKDRINNALVLFDSPDVVQAILEKSSDRGSFWSTQSLFAYPLEPSYYEIFYKNIHRPKVSHSAAPKFSKSSSSCKRWGREIPPHISRLRPDPTGNEPPAKRPRKEGATKPTPGAGSENTKGNDRHLVPPKLPAAQPSRTPSTAPESIEWMRARITQLESDLDTARAARDMAISEQSVAVKAQETEKQARRDAMMQKSAAEAAQSRAEAEQARLLAELEKVLSQQASSSSSSKEMDLLREQLAVTEGKLKEVQAVLGESTIARGRVKELEKELVEAQDQAHKLQIQKSELKRESEKEIGRLKGERGSAQEQFEQSQNSLQSMERKYSTTRRKYNVTKEKLGTYKSRLQSETALLKRLQETLTPAAYQSLGATHETLGAFLSAIGMPPVSDQGDMEPKMEGE